MPLTNREAAERWLDAEWALLQGRGGDPETVDRLELDAIKAWTRYRLTIPQDTIDPRYAVDIRHLTDLVPKTEP